MHIHALVKRLVMQDASQEEKASQNASSADLARTQIWKGWPGSESFEAKILQSELCIQAANRR